MRATAFIHCMTIPSSIIIDLANPPERYARLGESYPPNTGRGRSKTDENEYSPGSPKQFPLFLPYHWFARLLPTDDPRLRTTAIRIEKGGAVPGFWNAEFENVHSQCGGVAFIFSQIIGAEICEDQNCAEKRDNCH